MPRPLPFSKLARPIVPLVAFALLLGSIAVYLFLKHGTENSPRALAQSTAEGIRQALGFTPSVSVNGLTVIEQTLPILELATAEQTLFKEYSWSHTFLGSTKTLMLRGEFVIKAGFDVHEEFAFNIDQANANRSEQQPRIVIRLPKAKILSLEMKTYKVERDESGFWNGITPDDRTRAVAALQADARLSAEQSGILQKAREMLEQKIRASVQERGFESIRIVESKD
jgi:Protein of unknown function (DUF4230)